MSLATFSLSSLNYGYVSQIYSYEPVASFFSYSLICSHTGVIKKHMNTCLYFPHLCIFWFRFIACNYLSLGAGYNEINLHFSGFMISF